jgi:hypothetical protein
VAKMRAHGSQWISHKINIWHPEQLKKFKSWEPFWSYQQNNTANPAHLPQNWAKLAKLAVLFSSKTSPRFFIFLIVLCAKYSSFKQNLLLHMPSYFLGILFQS